MRRYGRIICGAGIIGGLLLAVADGVLDGTVPNYGSLVGVRVTLEAVGITAWVVGVFVGIPWWIVDAVRERRGQKSTPPTRG